MHPRNNLHRFRNLHSVQWYICPQPKSAKSHTVFCPNIWYSSLTENNILHISMHPHNTPYKHTSHTFTHRSTSVSDVQNITQSTLSACTHTDTHRARLYMCIHRQSLTRHLVHRSIICLFWWPISMLPVYNLQELCDEVSVLGKLLLKQARPSPAERPPSPRSYPVVQYPCHRLQHHHVCAWVYIMCQYECVCIYVHACVRVWQSCEKWADTEKRLHNLSKLQSQLTQPLYFGWVFQHCERAWQCGGMCMRAIYA